MSQMLPLVWLLLGALLIGAEIRTPAPVAAWPALLFLLRAAHMLPLLPAAVCVAVAIYAALAAGLRGIVPAPDPACFGVVGLLAITQHLPFVADRVSSSRLSGWTAMLIFPMAWTAVEFLLSRLTPNGSWGALAYTQYGNLPLMQLSAITGIW